MKQKWGIKEECQKLYAALCKFYCYLVLNKHEVILDLYCISSLRCQSLYTVTKAPLETTVSWSPWTLHTQLPPCLHSQHWTLQVWCNPSVHLAKLSQLTILSKACPSWVYNLVLDQVLVFSFPLMLSPPTSKMTCPSPRVFPSKMTCTWDAFLPEPSSSFLVYPFYLFLDLVSIPTIH